MIELLLVSGANEHALNDPDDDRLTLDPLLQTVGLPRIATNPQDCPFKGSVEAAQMLLHIGVDANERYIFDFGTSLHFAQTIQMVDLLVSYGAELNARNLNDQTATQFALACGRTSVAARLEYHFQLRVEQYLGRLGLVQWLPDQPNSLLKIPSDLKTAIAAYFSFDWICPPRGLQNFFMLSNHV